MQSSSQAVQPLQEATVSRPIIWPRRLQRLVPAIIIHGILLFGLVFMLAPLIWMISTSLKDPAYVFNLPPQWLPQPVRWSNYAQAFQQEPLLRYFGNTALITGLDVVGKVVSCSLVAFAFSRLHWRGRDTLFLVMLSTLMLPPQVTLIPQFVGYRVLGWTNTFLPLIVPNFFGGPFLTFLLRQFFMSLPQELDAAARIDGASTFGIFWRIILPQARPGLAAVAIFEFTGAWNDFLGPLIYLNTPDHFTLALGLRAFVAEWGPQWHLLMAASLVTILPVLVLFFLGQRYFIQGIVFSGVKG
ncbi:MAG TPA: carbohydrate ABC transporter permease [Chloroflexota bacterium]